MDRDTQFVVDTPLPGTVLAASAGTWVQLAKQGAFKDPRYGNFNITQADFDKWLANFAAYFSPTSGREGIPVDVDHGPEKRGETEAAGWITSLEQRGQDLWGLVNWNDLGKELVSERRYVYLSPSYAHDFKDEGGASHGTAMVGVALTNRPFLRMATVTLSAVPLAAVEVIELTPIAPADMALLEDLKAKLAERGITLAADATEADAISALDGLAVPAEEAQDPRTLSQRLQAEGLVVLSAADHQTLRGQAESGAAAAETLRTQRFEVAFDKALDAGRALPAQKDQLVELYDARPEVVLAMLTDGPQLLNTEPQGHGGGTGVAGVSPKHQRDAEAEGNDYDPDRAAVASKADQILAAEPQTDYATAVERAATELGVSL